MPCWFFHSINYDGSYMKVIRGGYWGIKQDNIDLVSRYRNYLNYYDSGIGFRVRKMITSKDYALRGGSFINTPDFLRSTDRLDGWPAGRDADLGLRVIKHNGEKNEY